MPPPYPTRALSVCTYSFLFLSPILTLTRQTLNVLVFQYFYSILQLFVDVEHIPLV